MNRIKDIMEEIFKADQKAKKGYECEVAFGDKDAHEEAKNIAEGTNPGVGVSLMKKSTGEAIIGLVTSGPISEVSPGCARSIAADIINCAELAERINSGENLTEEQIKEIVLKQRGEKG